MKLHAYRLRNYRRLRDVVVELDDQISIFVGSNNSGKTSAAQGLQMMLEGKKGKFKLFDFSAPLWKTFDEIGEAPPGDVDAPVMLPSISLDLWFTVGAQDLVAAMPLLPSTQWQGRFVGIRVSFEPGTPYEVVRRFRERREAANAAAAASNAAGVDYQPWPQSLTKYLADELANEYEVRYYVLDESQFEAFRERDAGYEPLPVSRDPGGASILKSLLKVDFLRAQRHLDDPDSESAAGSSARDENLSKRLSRFYERNLEKRADDHAMLKALSSSEKGLNDHLEQVFRKTLERLSKLGYPGIKNPEIIIRAQLDPSKVLNQDATRVHYVLPGDDKAQLPDSYNGLGYKNLIYMVVELLDLHERWKDDELERPPLHLIFIEEPEAHLHAQVQQVFIRNVLTLLQQEEDEDDEFFSTQLVVTTHSPHILYERGFAPIRYFRRTSDALDNFTEVKNLSRFKPGEDEKSSREFLQRYLKLTHCDLFFSDAAILVEGNVERLLMPAMIESAAKRLRSSALTILEVGGAFAHKFKDLIEFVGITTLVITDIDSVLLKEGAQSAEAAAEEDDDSDAVDGDDDSPKTFEVDDGEDDNGVRKTSTKRGSTCFAEEIGALTANQTLISWVPQKRSVADLLAVVDNEKVIALPNTPGASVRIAYQTRTQVVVGEAAEELCGRTLEEAFGLENCAWVQDKANQRVGLRLRPAPTSPRDLALRLHKRVTGKNFDKTRFALEVLASGPAGSWQVPRYIAEGLKWLESQVAHEAEAEGALEAAADAMQIGEAGATVVLESQGAADE
jgi:predicted ATP-dependent endonuclease of OLD family